MSSAFVLKLAIAPCFVAVVTVIGRRSGPAVAGLLASLPVVAGPILGLLVATQGKAFATTSAFAAALGVVPTMVFALVFASRPRHVPAAVCLGLAYAAYFVVAFGVVFVPVTLLTAIVVPAVAWPVVMRVFPIPDGPSETLPALARASNERGSAPVSGSRSAELRGVLSRHRRCSRTRRRARRVRLRDCRLFRMPGRSGALRDRAFRREGFRRISPLRVSWHRRPASSVLRAGYDSSTLAV